MDGKILNSNNSKKIISAALLVVIGTASFYLVKNRPNNNLQVGIDSGANYNLPLVSGIIYKSGEYEYETTYRSPGGNDKIKVSLKISGDNIQYASVASDQANNDTSNEYIEKFSGNFSEKIIGQPLQDLELDTVSGASLTTRAFNQALGEIRIMAKI